MRRDLIRTSKFLSLVLRHDPSVIGVELDDGGWIDVSTLLRAARAKRPGLTRELLDEVVRTNDKQRFMYSEDGNRIRAAQGHSIGVDLGLAPATPPAELYHGTAERNLASIREHGLRPGNRDYVHLSHERDTAHTVGTRHGRPVVLIIEAEQMVAAGHVFHVSENGVWLTRAVPPAFIRAPT